MSRRWATAATTLNGLYERASIWVADVLSPTVITIHRDDLTGEAPQLTLVPLSDLTGRSGLSKASGERTGEAPRLRLVRSQALRPAGQPFRPQPRDLISGSGLSATFGERA